MFHALWSAKTKKYLDESILVLKKRVENVFYKFSKRGKKTAAPPLYLQSDIFLS